MDYLDGEAFYEIQKCKGSATASHNNNNNNIFVFVTFPAPVRGAA